VNRRDEMQTASFEDFYRQAKDPCFRAVLAAIADQNAAEDALAEAMARAFDRWPRLRSHPNPEAWVVRVAVNSHRSWWRRWRRSVDGRTGQANRPAGLAEPFDETLLAALRDLSRRQREVVALRVLLDLDTATTARELGIAPKTVTVHLHRALTRLREVVAPEGESQPEEAMR